MTADIMSANVKTLTPKTSFSFKKEQLNFNSSETGGIV